MNSIILADAASAAEIFCAVANFVTPLGQNSKQMFLKEELLISSLLTDLTHQSVLLINNDISLETYPHFTQSHPVITYGCNPKATVTASSINEDKIMCCVQRPLMLEGFYPVLPQEFSVSFCGESVLALLGAICILLLSFGESFFS